MTPDIGVGGNGAIESAAALANNIYRILSQTNGKPSLQAIRSGLEKYQEDRWPRIKPMVSAANKVSRVNTYATIFDWFQLRWIVPWLGDAVPGVAGTIGAERLGYLPVPTRSTSGTCPFNPEQGLGRSESKVKRAVIAFPLVALGILCMTLFQITFSRGTALWVDRTVQDGQYPSPYGSFVPLRRGFFSDTIPGKIWDRASIMFLPSVVGNDPAHRLQMISFLIDLAPFIAVWLAESSRRANEISVIRP